MILIAELGLGASLSTARYGHSATLLPNSKMLVAGGNGRSSSISITELYTIKFR